ncbi:MAG: DNA polymerase-3 subunit alpha [Flavobacteriales bacterium]|jgi:DNA polymerase-3 subunit alpha
MQSNFVHLRVRTEFSLVDSIVRIKGLVARLQKFNMPACAITDVHNFYGLLKFYKSAQGAGIKPICGADFFIQTEDPDGIPSQITLLAMNERGYKNITELISLSFTKGQRYGKPYLQKTWISEKSEGIIGLSNGKFGDIGQAIINGNMPDAEMYLEHWKSVFPDRFYLEIQRTGRENDEQVLHASVELADRTNCPLVATNDVRFLDSSQFDVHEARVCIGEGRALDDPRRDKIYSDEQFLRSPEEMIELFSDIPDAISNTVEIAKRCSLEIELGKYYLPEYPIPDGLTQDDYFEKISREGLDVRLEKILDKTQTDYTERKEEYLARLRFELDIICQMGFPGYFLIVMDFIQWAKDHDIPVGPGRGSGAGSLIAYALNITDLDPLQYDLLFERFLNPERVSMPDFDIDFCMEKRDKVIGYVADNYGREAVSQIITFGTMAAKAVIRDVARAQGKSYGLADKLSKMIPPDPGMTLMKAHGQEEVLRDFLNIDTDGAEIWEMALQLEGITRNVGKHAGGVVIAPTKLTDFSPLYCDESGEGLVTQFDKNDVEDAGLVKFDFLGLRTLTIIDWAVAMINADRAIDDLEPVVIDDIPLDCSVTFKMLKNAETTAVFQLESRGMKELIKRLQPDDLEDLIALVALFRPGPLQSGMVDDFINRKHGRAKVAYPDAKYQHERLQPILEPTYGVIVYQEQVMQIAQVLAGYSLGGADMLRRAMGKKNPEEMAKQRSVFADGAQSEGIDPELAMKIFDLVEKFAGYGFNKSHSAAYALVSYQTAWLKAHYPAHFMAATMSSDMDKTDKVVTFIEEAREMKLVLRPPDVNEGQFQFTVDREGNIIYGLGAIKGLGEGPIGSILDAREGGEFKNLFDFADRVDLKRVNKRALVALVRSGAFDKLGLKNELDYDRAVLFAAIPEAVKAAEQSTANNNAGMSDLFGDVVTSASSDEDPYKDFHRVRRWSTKDRLNGERETLGLYLTGHPIDEYENELKHFVSGRLSNLRIDKERQTVAGLVVAFRLMKTKRGDNMAFVTLDDRTGRLEVAIFSDTYDNHRDDLRKDALLVIEGQVSKDDFSGGIKMRADKISDLAKARENRISAICITLRESELQRGYLKQLDSTLRASAGGQCPIIVNYQKHDKQISFGFNRDWLVAPTDDLIQSLRVLYGTPGVEVRYR